MTKPLQALLQKDMDRKEFLLTMGFGVASLFGFSTIINMLTGKSMTSRGLQQRSSGYGGSRYGQ